METLRPLASQFQRSHSHQLVSILRALGVHNAFASRFCQPVAHRQAPTIKFQIVGNIHRWVIRAVVPQPFSRSDAKLGRCV